MSRNSTKIMEDRWRIVNENKNQNDINTENNINRR